MPPTRTPPSPLPRTHLFLDFDGTLTHADTLSSLASIPYALRARRLHPPSSPSLPSPSPPHPPAPPSPLPPFSHFSHTYRSALAAHTTDHHRTSLSSELAFRASTRALEEASVQRVEDAGLFKGVTRGDVVRGAERAVGRGEVRVRGGWEALVGVGGGGSGGGAAPGDGDAVGYGGGRTGRRREVIILSVNWSRTWITAVLDADLARRYPCSEGQPPLTLEALGVRVVANELVGLDEAGGSQGRLDRWFGKEGGGLWVGGDKGRVVREWLGGMGGDGGWSVFVGDSVGNLEGLVGCDVGVWMRGEVEDGEVEGGGSELGDVLERCEVRCKWVGGWRGERGRGERVWWARGWGEVLGSGILEGWG
ncbi:hypothetical protein MMC34_006293 [Xylographa carneopallida]|nr:hypothetical protein [Xylographa carneopallida]